MICQCEAKTSNSANETLFSEAHDAVEKRKGWNSSFTMENYEQQKLSLQISLVN